MEDFDDIREALKLVPGGTIEWQMIQTRLGLSLLTGVAQSLDRRTCENERQIADIQKKLGEMDRLIETKLAILASAPLPATAPPPHDDAWKTKAVTVIVWGALVGLASMAATLIEHVIELRLHIG